MNKTISKYIRQNIKYPILIEEAPSDHLGMIIVIPCHNEPDVVASIRSILACDPPKCDVEIIIVINASSANDPEVHDANIRSFHAINEIDAPNWCKIYAIMNNNFSPKKAGVGLARKIGMDDAVRRFMDLERSEGVIVCYDADSGCDPNYLQSIQSFFGNASISSAGINYEHPISGVEHDGEIYHYIIQYELHLRYFIYMQSIIGLPYAYHTVGSSMACRTDPYCAVGGMNQRKAGEDFYFLHKLIKYGGHGEINDTRIIPSPRISDRVPFGTGKAVSDLADSDSGIYKTYHPQSFFDLKKLVDDLPMVYQSQAYNDELPESVAGYLQAIDGDNRLAMIIDNTADYPSFEKRFWVWFDAFHLMKYLHFAREHYYEDIDVSLVDIPDCPIGLTTNVDKLEWLRSFYKMK